MRIAHVISSAALAVAAFGIGVCTHGAVLVQDTMTSSTETGVLGGSAADTVAGSSTWQVYAAINGTNPYTNAPAPATPGPASNPPGVTPTRDVTGTNFGAFAGSTNDGGYIGFTPSASGLITASVHVKFASNAASTSTNPTAWAAIALTTSQTRPDVLGGGGVGTAAPNNGNGSGVAGWLFIRPWNNTNYGSVFTTTGTGSNPGNLTAIPAADSGVWGLDHDISLTYDPAAGKLNAFVDGTQVLATDFTYGSAPLVNGVLLTGRTQTPAVTTATPSSFTFSNLSVTQVPEPASLGLLAMGGLMMARRRRGA